ncbi:branched-chain amino acid transport system II carrier protein [Enterobacter mori]|uniref:branched-chain amino acid transport system II carrier protein n=1 Tax=Enterobacter mori TaxID=539813 RepID=UPI00398A9975
MKSRELIIVGFMTFALFVGAGNIIFPPYIGMVSGENMWFAAGGFLATGVGLPVLALIAMARNNCSLDELTRPAGNKLGLLLTIVCYLALGPLLCTPRTATVSYEIGIHPVTSGHFPLKAFSTVFFMAVVICSLNPSRLVQIVGKFLSPVKIIALGALGLYAFLNPGGEEVVTTAEYISQPFSRGLINGYLTLDTLAALVFSLIVVNAIRLRGVTDSSEITKNTIAAALIAGVGLIYVYVSLFYLGVYSHALVPAATNGAEVLQAYISANFGYRGGIILAFIITIACLVTAIGLTSACATFFSKLTGLSYKLNVIVLALVSAVLSNMGLTEIIRFSLPALTSIYPPFIVLVLAGALLPPNARSAFVFLPAIVTALLFGIIQSVVPVKFMPGFIIAIPLYDEQMVWLLPTVVVLIVMSLIKVGRAKMVQFSLK